jgi:hypothetical protein
MTLTILEIPKADLPVAVAPPGIAPEKLRAVRDAERELAEASRRGCSPQELSRLLNAFWSAQKAAAPTPEPLGLDSCPSCNGSAVPIPGERPDRRRCVRCGANFSSTRQATKPCPSCQSPLTVKFSHGSHCNQCGRDF